MRAVAHKYAQQGYRVIQHPPRQDRPDFLAAFEPDLIAYGAEVNIVVEVRSNDTLLGATDLVDLTTAVNAQPGWRIDLVVTNPRKQAIVPKDSILLFHSETQERLLTARQLLAMEQVEAAFVLAWMAIEARLREFGEHGSLPVDYVRTDTLLRDAYSFGMVALADYETLRVALQQRNAVVHGYRASDDLGSLAASVIDIAETLLTVDVAALAS